jgi:AcrR family transcriptional regulator
MAPRTYSQQRRAETAATTRGRIRDAAVELYRERGVAGTTLRAVAERADVSRGTILNHFQSADGLLESILEEAAAETALPDVRDVEGAANEADRIHRFVDATLRFFDRSAAWWPVFAADMGHPAVRAREQAYLDVMGRLHVAAFTDLAADRIVAAAVRAFVNYAPFNDLRAGGLSLDEVIDLVAEVLTGIVTRRREAVQLGGTA